VICELKGGWRPQVTALLFAGARLFSASTDATVKSRSEAAF
jgi:hypothetical protein